MRITNFRENNYHLGRVFAVFIISPFLIYRGYQYKDNLLILIGIMMFLWDGCKLLIDNKVVNQMYFQKYK